MAVIEKPELWATTKAEATRVLHLARSFEVLQNLHDIPQVIIEDARWPTYHCPDWCLFNAQVDGCTNLAMPAEPPLVLEESAHYPLCPYVSPFVKLVDEVDEPEFLKSSLRIYLASSWRNDELVMVVYRLLRQYGFDVDAFCNQPGGRVGFNIADCLAAAGHSLDEVDAITALRHPAVAEQFRIAFREDKKWLDWCNCVIMLMPCGRSAHLEAGYAKGQGKLFYIYWMTEMPKGEFDNMYQFADGMFRREEIGDLVHELMKHEAGI